GRLDPGALGRALSEIVRRHEVLRTTFATAGGEPVQVVGPARALPFALCDLAGLAASDREAVARGLVLAEAVRPFDLARGPVLRVALLRLGADAGDGDGDGEEHLLLLTAHHIAFDAWSSDVFLNELSVLYQAFSAGQASPLPELRVQYADFAVWQRHRLSGEVLEPELEYWKGQLAGAPQQLELPTDRPRPAMQTFRGRSRPCALSPELSASLTALSRRRGATLYMTLLAGLQVLLSRYTGQDDVSVGSPIAGRNRREIEDLIGFFVNSLVLRAVLSAGSGEPSFCQLLDRARRVALDAYAHQDLPFERLVEELQPERDLSTSPLFQVVFALQNAPQETLELPGLTLSAVAVEGTTAKFDLTLSLTEGPAGIAGGLEYNVDLFDATTMDRFLAHFERLLEGVVEDPERRLSELPWWPQAARHQLLVEWNATASGAAGSRPIHELFERQVRQTPEAVAVVLDHRRLSYRELNRRANRLAHRLQALEVGPEAPVGIYLERSPEMVTAILAVLKAGGHYVPLDPDHPPERVRLMMEDARIPLVVTRRERAAQLPASAARTLELDSAWQRSSAAAENPASGAVVGNLAYVLYTSGSTGRPKGVGCSHLGVINLLADFTSRAPLGVGDASSWWTSPNFDVSVYEIFSALLAGGRVHIVPPRVHGDGERLVEWLAAERIAGAYVTPSMLQDLADRAGRRPHALALRRLLVGVEPIPERVLVAIREGIPGLRIINGYGPTEATVCCTLYNVGRRPEAERTTPLGRALRNTAIYLLDRTLRPVPCGAAGELAIAGHGLARGYQQRPSLTAERFVPDPWSEQAGSRLYRTGDLVRALPTGELMFQGRIDHQVKIRGFRIELGEIEAALGRHPAVREAVVLARADGAGSGPRTEMRLVAYLVAGEVGGAEIAELREHLKRQLPDYMVPEAWVELGELPLTPNGKVDRRALPAPAWGRDEGRELAAPRTPVEEMLAGAWSELLGVEAV
ncbi:MAG: amino acid adenylation domain-containing protein, partial [bacterium]|nr:amino acid adenylation domain-containing protein [bacterium]